MTNVNALFRVSALALSGTDKVCAPLMMAFLLQLGMGHRCLCLELLLPSRLAASRHLFSHLYLMKTDEM